MNTLRTIAALFPLLFTACHTVAETGRSALVLMPSSQMHTMGLEAYAEATSQHPVITSGKDYEMLQRLGKKIAAVAGHDEFEWEFKLLDAPDQVNAFCLPGGKVAVYTGILAMTQNEDGLAAVVGHEIAHATAQHGNERVSQNMVAKIGLTATSMAFDQWSDLDATEKAGIVTLIGGAAKIGVLLPYSRTHESEADKIGLIYLIRAGYDPYEAPKLWERMAAQAGSSGPAFMSTHPEPLERAKQLRAWIPEIQAREAAGGSK